MIVKRQKSLEMEIITEASGWCSKCKFNWGSTFSVNARCSSVLKRFIEFLQYHL